MVNVMTRVLVLGSTPGSSGRGPASLSDVPNSMPAPGTSGVRAGFDKCVWN